MSNGLAGLDDGVVVSLIKPHYEAEPNRLVRGVLPAEELEGVIARVKKDMVAAGFEIRETVVSPILGTKGNTEILAELRPVGSQGRRE